VAADSNTHTLICAVDLGGTNLRAANIDREGRIHERARLATPKTNNPDDIVAAIASAVKACDEQAAARGARVESISIVVPGSVQAETGLVVNAPNVPSIINFQLSEALGAHLQHQVIIENDANAAALGEMWQGAARGFQTIACLTLGTGVGGGIILNSELWRGIDGTAGEIGHTSIDPFGGVECNCGSVGCLEAYASATAIVRMTREGLPAYPESALTKIADEELTAAAIARAANDGDEFARGVFKRAGVYLGIAAANIVNTLNPEMIVIGGGVSAAFDLFAPSARDEMRQRAFPVPAARCQIVKAECGDDAGLLGAAWLALAGV
jgi:glucokinase